MQGFRDEARVKSGETQLPETRTEAWLGSGTQGNFPSETGVRHHVGIGETWSRRALALMVTF